MLPLDDKGAEELVAGYDGIALTMDDTGAVLAASGAGRHLLEDPASDSGLMIQALVVRALETAEILLDTILAEADGQRVALELTALPFAKNRCLVLGRNKTFDLNLRSALIDSRQRYKDLVEVSSDFAFELGPGGVFTFVSQHGGLGHEATNFNGRRPEEFALRTGNGQAEVVRDAFAGVNSDQARETWMCRADGTAACLQVTSRPVFDEDGAWQGARGVCRDVTLEREKDAALAASFNRERLFNRILVAIRDEVEPQAMLDAAATAIALAMGAAGCCIYRLVQEGETSKTFVLAADHGGRPPAGATATPTLHPAPGMVTEAYHGRWLVMSISTVHRNRVNGVAVLWRNVAAGPLAENDRLLVRDVVHSVGIVIEQLANREDIVRLSRTDSLTGLLNRRAFLEEDLPRRITRMAGYGKTAALFYIDLDNFKPVNDLRGHQEGDLVLLRLRDVLLEQFRPGDSIGRLGGDEFVVWMDCDDPAVVETRGRLLLKAASEALAPYSADAKKPLGLSIGVALFDPDDAETPDQCMDRADAAMYTAKRSGKRRLAIAPSPSRQEKDPEA